MKKIGLILACLALASTAVYAEVPDEVIKEFQRQQEIENYKCEQSGNRKARYTGGSYGNSSNQETKGRIWSGGGKAEVGAAVGTETKGEGKVGGNVSYQGKQENHSQQESTSSNWECY